MAATNTVRVTKLDAAKRQLRTAIELWFRGGDPVSIQTLVAASHEIIHTLFRRKGLRGLAFDSDIVREERRGEWARLIKFHATFFKHAQKDPDAETDFNPALNDYLIVVCISGLDRMQEPLGDAALTFTAWMGLHEPDLFLKDPFAESTPVNLLQKLRLLSKRDFYESYPVFLREQRRLGHL